MAEVEAAAASKTANQPPFAAEYAKSGRASCKSCKEPIAKVSSNCNILKLLRLIPSNF